MLVIIGNTIMGLSALALFWFTMRLGQPAPVKPSSEGPSSPSGSSGL